VSLHEQESYVPQTRWLGQRGIVGRSCCDTHWCCEGRGCCSVDAGPKPNFVSKTYPQGRGEKQTLGRPQFFFNHSCSHRISASGRLAGSFWKHCLRKSSRRGETVSGMGGSVSSTIRNMTIHTTISIHTMRLIEFSLTRHAVSDFGIRRSPGEQLDHSTS